MRRFVMANSNGGLAGGSDRDRPDLAGGYALQEWLMKFAWAWASAYRSALRRGYPADIIIVACPRGDRLDVPPRSCTARTKEELERMIPGIGSHLGPPRPGFFVGVATRDSDRLKGTAAAEVQMAGEVGAICGDSARTDLCGGTLARAFPTATTGDTGWPNENAEAAQKE
jgi:hypothetical protein